MYFIFHILSFHSAASTDLAEEPFPFLFSLNDLLF